MTEAMVIQVPSKRSRILAIKPGKDRMVVAHGNSRSAVLAKARKAGVQDPILMYVPKCGKRYIY
ncbi:MAG: hypothetical protein JXR37_05360 [Kiritimatiellae bacterium]|nr:hypothetical protein [Kiritimatiellia bacterium]